MSAPFPAWLSAILRDAGLPEPYRMGKALSGGCINDCFAVHTGAGPVFVKTNASVPPGFFAAEKDGLDALGSARTSLVIPRVLALHPGTAGTGRQTLVLEWLEPAPADDATWEALGRGLAELHRRAAARHGFSSDNFLGATPQPNGWMDDWAGFFAERRLGHMLRLLEGRGVLPSDARRTYDALLRKLPELLSHAPAPSLLHGDLWAGNFLATTRGPALLDPASHHGDRECDLAMMRLFGGFPPIVFDAYAEAWPLPDGWKERQPVYRLYHLLNHQYLFGAPYGAQALAEARALRL